MRKKARKKENENKQINSMVCLFICHLLFDGELIDLVQHIDTRNIFTISFNDIDQLINRGITTTNDIRGHNSIFATNRKNDLLRENTLRNHCLEINRTLFPPSKISDEEKNIKREKGEEMRRKKER
jgi:hypothetical protein